MRDEMGAGDGPDAGLRFTWAAIYAPEWDNDPGAYVAAGLVAWGYSRRLAKIVAAIPNRDFKAYLGVQHYDPGRWGVAGEPRAVFFLSLFLNGRTLALRTFPTLALAHAGLADAYLRIQSGR